MKLGYGRIVVLLLALAVFWPAGLEASATRTRYKPHTTHHRVATKRRASYRRPATSSRKAVKGQRSSRKRTVARRRRTRRSTAYTRLAHMQMAPGRVEEIQQALLGAGAFSGSPSGRWDDATRQAMARYQASNGFAVTGLPDAKSLMKLGLGPHPLPKEVEPAPRPGVAPLDAAPTSSASADPHDFRY